MQLFTKMLLVLLPWLVFVARSQSAESRTELAKLLANDGAANDNFGIIASP